MSRLSRVKGVENGKVIMGGYGIEGRNLPVISPSQIEFLPRPQEEGLFLSLEDSHGYLGSIQGVSSLNEGELRLSCGGGYIYLRQNGSIVINGVIITKEGKILGG